MNTRSILLLVVLLFPKYSFGQNLTKELIDNWVKSKDTSFKWNERTLYIINDKNYKNDAPIDSLLKTLHYNNVIDIEYLIPTIKPNPPINYLIKVSSKYEMKDSDKEPLLHNARLYLADKTLADSIEFFLNDSIIERKRASELLNSIKSSEIYYMDSFIPNRNSYFRHQLKKRQIKIWTKK
jgi:hypothetical protein